MPVRAALPAELQAVLADVIDFRQRNRDALSVFQNFIQEVVTTSSLPEILGSPVEAKIAVLHIQNEYDRTVARGGPSSGHSEEFEPGPCGGP